MRLPLKSPLTAAWLFSAAFLIIVLVAVGGATRLTQSGLSITDWKPISGVIPPQTSQDWQAEFDNYKKIPQFSEINPHMQMDQFKGIFWWEWTHRLIARVVVGVVLFGGFVVLLLLREIPARLIWRCVGLFVLGGAQGGVGWLMVASGLSQRVSVAPEMLAAHLLMALLLLIATVWTAFEALEGGKRGRGAPGGWMAATIILLVLVVLQCVLGAFVAGNQAGLVYNDWPLMNGHVLPPAGGSHDAMGVLHDQGVVQFAHRCNAYLLLIYATAFAVILGRKAQDDGLKFTATALSTLIWVQATLGVATLVTVVAFGFALTHQVLAACLVALATALTWMMARADRGFRRGRF
ncbi:MAG: COX15/CtaA family protein [Asticcacaulis sp.]|uniref:COX15/CtaA family protein n=1 Tax=Asticcacaulis sp. TaxID=1872648 RepID=UPI003F7C5A09